MKKGKSLGKTIGLSILVVLIIVLIIRGYHYSILRKISDKTKEFYNSDNYNVKLKEVYTYDEGSTTIERESAKKDNRIYSKTNIDYKDNPVSTANLLILDEDFLNQYYMDEIENSLFISTGTEEDMNMYSGIPNFYSYSYSMDNTYWDSNLKSKISNWIDNKILFPVVFSQECEGKDCYVFNMAPHRRIWVDRESLLPLKVELKDNDYTVYQTVYYEYDKILNEVFEIPNPNDFDEVTYYDSGKQPELSWGKVAEEAISGTTLKPGEQLIENIELEENEVLNFLGLTPNESGIISLDIYSYDTYNKFREKYSGLRELTEKDFERYYVTLAYKDGYKLNYIEQWESSQSYYFNYVVSAEKSNKDNLMVLITSKGSKNSLANFVENDEKLKVDSYQAFETIQEYLIDFQNFYELKEQNSIGYSGDKLYKLTNEEFAKLEYIKTPVKGEEPICWKIDYRGYEYDTVVSMSVYVDATTGYIIGSVDFKK